MRKLLLAAAGFALGVAVAIVMSARSQPPMPDTTIDEASPRG